MENLTTNSSLFWNNTPNVQPLMPIADRHMDLVRVICEVWISFPIAVLGIIGNLLAFTVLCKQQKLTTTVLLQALAVTDTLVLASSILLRSMRYVGWDDYNDAHHYIFVVLYPCVYFFRLADTWLTVMLTIDRYIAVCRPLQAQRICTLRRTYISIIIVVFATFVFSLPRFFEFRLTTEDDPREGFVHTPLIRNPTYTIAYRIVMFNLVMYLVPMLLLIVLNILLMYTLHKAYNKRHAMMCSEGMTCNKSVIDEGRRIRRGVTIIVSTVVTVCVFCNITAMVNHIIWSLQMCIFKLRYLEYYRRFMSNISNVMITLNSAVNFVIYCMFSRTFRVGLQQTCRCENVIALRQRGRSDRPCDTSIPGNTSYTSLGHLPSKTNRLNSLQSQKSNDAMWSA